LAALLLQGAGANAASGARPIVILSREEIAHLGVRTAPAELARFTPRIRGYGVVTNLSSVAQADADIRSAEAAMLDSDAQLVRANRLYSQKNGMHATSAQALDAAQHLAESNRAQLALADRKEVALFGLHAPWRGPPRDDTILKNLSAGQSVLVQVTFPLGIFVAASPSLLEITRIDPQLSQKSWSSKIIWDAPADPSIPGRSFFTLVDQSALAQGEHVLVYAPTGNPVEGVRIPAEAVLLSEDKPWCYAVVSDGHFRRVAVDLGLELGGGYFVAKNLRPGQRVVVSGTGLLLARELGAATPGQD
jgi:multidrug efflux pump subunit AcrA (membrane-fusion protein)